jgi:hypothetical protein
LENAETNPLRARRGWSAITPKTATESTKRKNKPIERFFNNISYLARIEQRKRPDGKTTRPDIDDTSIG